MAGGCCVIAATLLALLTCAKAQQYKTYHTVEYDDMEGFQFLMKRRLNPGYISHKGYMEEDSIGKVTVYNEYVVGSTGHGNATTLIAGAPFSISLEDRDPDDDFLVHHAMTVGDARDGCLSNRANPLQLDPQGTGDDTKYPALIGYASGSASEKMLPPDDINTYEYVGYQKGSNSNKGYATCSLQTVGGKNYCVFGKAAYVPSGASGTTFNPTSTSSPSGGSGLPTDATNTPASSKTVIEEMAIPFPGFYSMCICLNMATTGSSKCASAQSAAAFSVDVGMVLQVAGFKQKNLEEKYCAAYNKCTLDFLPAAFYSLSNVNYTTVQHNVDLGTSVDVTTLNDAEVVTGGVNTATIADQLFITEDFTDGSTKLHCSADVHFTNSSGTPYHAQAKLNVETNKVSWVFTLKTAATSVTASDFQAELALDPTLAGTHYLCWFPWTVYGGSETAPSGVAKGQAKFVAAKFGIAGPTKTNTMISQKVTPGTVTSFAPLAAYNYKVGDKLLVVKQKSSSSSCGTGGGTNNDGKITFKATKVFSSQYNASALLTSTASGSPSWSLYVPKGNFGVQGDYHLCWCPGTNIGGVSCLDNDLTESNYLYEAGNVTIPGATIALKGAVCYPGYPCTVTVANTSCVGCTTSEGVQVVRRELASYDDGNTKNVFYETNCGGPNGEVKKWTTSATATQANAWMYNWTAFPNDASLEFGNIGRYVLCWGSSSPYGQPASDFETVKSNFFGGETPATPGNTASNSAPWTNHDYTFQVFGPSRENWITCKMADEKPHATEDFCQVTPKTWATHDAGTALLPTSLNADEFLLAGDYATDDEFIIGVKSTNDAILDTWPWTTGCGAGTAVFNSTLAATTNINVNASEPGIYEICYCPTKFCTDLPCTAADKMTNDLGCDFVSDFKTSGGIMVVEGPKKGADGGLSGTTLPVTKGEPFTITLKGYGLAGATAHKIMITETDVCNETASASSQIKYYPSGAAVSGSISGEAVTLPATAIQSATRDSTHHWKVKLTLTGTTKEALINKGLATGALVAFTASDQTTATNYPTGANEHTFSTTQVFQTWAADATSGQRRFYKVLEGPNDDLEFTINFMDTFPDLTGVTWKTDGHTIALADREVYPESGSGTGLYTNNDTAGTFTICWTGDGTSWYKWATLDVQGPRAFNTATGPSMWFAVPEVQKAGPLVLSFTPSVDTRTDSTGGVRLIDGSGTYVSTNFVYGEHQVNKQYRVRIRFPDTLKFKPLAVVDTSVAWASDGISTGATLTSYTTESQAVCGKMFYELWSSDAHGFPMPWKCWVEVGTTSGVTDVYMHFSKYAGLKAGAKYWIVMKAGLVKAASQVANSDIKVEISTLSDPTDPMLGIIETKELYYDNSDMTKAGVTLNTYAYNLTTSNPSDTTGFAELTASSGAAITIYDTAATELDTVARGANTIGVTQCTNTGCQIYMDFQVASGSKLKVGEVIYVPMYPLTFWDISISGSCHASLTCTAVDFFQMGGLKNTLRMEVTTEIAALTYVRLGFKINNARSHGGFQPILPLYGALLVEGGLMSNRTKWYLPNIGTSDRIQWSKEGSEASVASYIWDDPHGDMEDMNNDKRFQGSTYNILYAKIKFGMALYGHGHSSASKSSIYINLPNFTDPSNTAQTYTCKGDGSNVYATDSDAAPVHVLRYADYAGTNLTMPPGLGSLDAVWYAAETGTPAEACAIQLSMGHIIPAGTTLLFKLWVNNPAAPIKASDWQNEWAFYANTGFSNQVAGTETAYNTLRRASYRTVFTADAEDNRWAKNVPVVGNLSQEMSSLSPVDTFAPGATGDVAIMFKTIQSTGGNATKGGSITVFAPHGFAWDCNKDKIGMADPNNRGTWLPDIKEANVANSSRLCNIVLEDGEELLRDKWYGFTIPVTNGALNYTTTDFWSIATYQQKCYHDQTPIGCDAVDELYFDRTATPRYGLTMFPKKLGDTAEPVTFHTYVKAPTKGDMDSRSAIFDVLVLDARPYALTAVNTFAVAKIKLNHALPTTHNLLIIPPRHYMPTGAGNEVSNLTILNVNETVVRAEFVEVSPGYTTWTGTVNTDSSAPKYGIKVDNTYTNGFNVTNKLYYITFGVQVASGYETNPPVANSWFLESYHTLMPETTAAKRYTAMVSTPAQLINKLMNPEVSFVTASNATENTITFGLQTVAPIPYGGCLYVKFPSEVSTSGQRFNTTAANQACSLEMVGPTEFYTPPAPFHEMMNCSWEGETISGQTTIMNVTFHPIKDPLQPGKYRFGLKVMNPKMAGDAVANVDKFEFYSIKECNMTVMVNLDETINAGLGAPMKQALRDHQLDMMTSVMSKDIVPGFVSTKILGYTVLKPGADTKITFGFEPSAMTLADTNLATPYTLEVMAPAGYVFPLDCSNELDLYPFGNSTHNMKDPMYQKYWSLNTSFTLTSCAADSSMRSKATLTFSAWLESLPTYAFSINATNPVVAPDPNYFSIVLDDVAAGQAMGRMLYTFMPAMVTAKNPVVGGMNLLEFHLTTTQAISGKMASVTFLIPEEFTASSGAANLACRKAKVMVGETEFSVYNASSGTVTMANLETDAAGVMPDAAAKMICVAWSNLVIFAITDMTTTIPANGTAKFWFEVTNPTQHITMPPTFEAWSCMGKGNNTCGVRSLDGYVASNYSLDYGTIPGFITIPKLQTVRFDGPGGLAIEGKGNTDFWASLIIALPNTVQPPQAGDKIHLTAPMGFTVCSTANAKIPSVSTAGSFAIMPDVKLNGAQTICASPTQNKIEMVVNGTSSYQFNITIIGRNPNALIENNFWEVVYLRAIGGNQYSQKIEGWTIQPMLTSPSVSLAPQGTEGTSRVAGQANAQVTVAFTPVQNFDTIEVKTTNAFVFSSVAAGSGTAVAASDGVTVSSLTGMGGTPFTLVLSGITSPATASPTGTSWAINTMLGSSPRDFSAAADYGALSSVFGAISGVKFYAMDDTGASTSHMLNSKIKVTFDFNTPAAPASNGFFVIKAPTGYSVTMVMAPADSSFPVAAGGSATVAVGNFMAVALTGAIPTGTTHKVTIEVQTPATPTTPTDPTWYMMIAETATLTTEQVVGFGTAHRVHAYATYPYTSFVADVGAPVGGLTPALTTPLPTAAVGAQGVPWEWTITPGLAADATVTGGIKMKFMPQSGGWSFPPTNCAGAGNDIFMSCTGGNSATLTETTTSLVVGTAVTFRVLTNHPTSVPANATEWTIEIMEGTQTVMSGSVPAGPQPVRMPATVAYAPKASAAVKVSFTFTNSMAVTGGRIEFTGPTGFSFSTSTAAHLDMAALGPDATFASTTNIGSISNVTLMAGSEKRFSLTMTTAASASNAMFWLVIKDASGMVVDANYEIAGADVSSSSVFDSLGDIKLSALTPSAVVQLNIPVTVTSLTATSGDVLTVSLMGSPSILSFSTSNTLMCGGKMNPNALNSTMCTATEGMWHIQDGTAYTAKKTLTFSMDVLNPTNLTGVQPIEIEWTGVNNFGPLTVDLDLDTVTTGGKKSGAVATAGQPLYATILVTLLAIALGRFF
ncbi:unnamed protein product [Vitrella brassicaformis CCMP3155]|uniref:Protein arginine methyltransferase 10 n=2 Tax=Vitrella brassicaformis TaxID=1169539 RepID=A0A0G4FC22_VITBC|nr:unnamed protein product [Vitrella brassicaformis CCMP3155]|eukprot:CEM10746.1 unnamed protein product [Vitrella brassicaformis CCMP3155]